MSEHLGNPVFDYRAGFRARAAKLQKILIRLGLLAMGGGAGAWLAGWSDAVRRGGGIALLGGLIFFGAGLVWGIYWRKKIISEFRRLAPCAPDKHG